MKYNLICLSLLVGLLGLTGGRSQADDGAKPPAAFMGVLTGVVIRWPISPVQGPGLPPGTAPAPEVKLIIYGPERQEIASVLTDEAGQYRVHLPPGTYLVEMAPRPDRRFTKNLPATVIITPGRETRLNITIDTGIR